MATPAIKQIGAAAFVGTALTYGISQLNKNWGVKVDLISAVAFSVIGAITGRGAYKILPHQFDWAVGIFVGASSGYLALKGLERGKLTFPLALMISTASALLGRVIYLGIK